MDERAAAAAAAAVAAAQASSDAAAKEMMKSPSDFSCSLSYELFVGQEKGHDDNNKEKMSIRSEGLESVSEQRRLPTNPTKMRKVSAVSVLITFGAPKLAKKVFPYELIGNIINDKKINKKIMTIIVFRLCLCLPLLAL